jgi:hypothetical protein
MDFMTGSKALSIDGQQALQNWLDELRTEGLKFGYCDVVAELPEVEWSEYYFDGWFVCEALSDYFGNDVDLPN